MNVPKRIVSLVPSLTELVVDLGVGESLAGRTRFCIHPEEFVKKVPIIGGTKNPRLDKIRKIKPDLIIANIEENRKEDIKELEKDFKIHLTQIETIQDALLEIHEIGKILGAGEQAFKLTSALQDELDRIPEEPLLRVAYFIWKDPWMSVGKDTYIHSVLDTWKLKNVFGDQKRYPKTTSAQTAVLNPDYILLSSEPYPFKEKHKQEFQDACPKSKIVLVNGEWFSWYGSRMLPSFKKLNTFRKAIS